MMRDGVRDAIRPTVTVVVPTHHRPDHLVRCLAALAAQTAPPEQVIVVRGPDDEAAAAVVASHGRVTDLVSPRPTVVHRLHAGAALATSDVVAFTDDDAAPHPDWVARLQTQLCDPTIGAIGGLDIQPGPPVRRVWRVGAIYPWGRIAGGHQAGHGRPRDVDHLRGVNMAFRRSLLSFPVGLRGLGAQGYNEVSLCLAVRAAGYRVVYDPSLRVDHQLAPRHEQGDGDRRRPGLAKRQDDAFNQTYTLLSFRPRWRGPHMVYVLLVGDRSTGGLARCVAAALTGDRLLANQLVPLWRIQREAWTAWKAAPLCGVAPDETFPTDGESGSPLFADRPRSPRAL